MTQVYNPTESKISIQYRGVPYSIEAGETKDIPADAASYWKTSIHTFVVIEPQTEVASTVEEVAEVAPVEEVAPEAEAEVAEEVVAEEVAPKKAKK